MELSNYKCPSCGRDLCVSGGILECRPCLYEEFVAAFLVKPDVNICVGKTKNDGKIIFFFNSNTKDFYITTKKFMGKEIAHGPYQIDQLLELQVSYENEILYEKKKSSTPMIAGGVLFGAVGALAGSMLAKEKQEVKRSSFAVLRIRIDDIQNPSYYIENNDLNTVYRFVNIVEMLNSDKG